MILVSTTGFAILLYGFVGIWMSDRRRKLWRLNLHSTFITSLIHAEMEVLQIILFAMTVGSVTVIPLFQTDKLQGKARKLVIGTLICQAFLLVLQGMSLVWQVRKVVAVEDERRCYKLGNGRPRLVTVEKRSVWRTIGSLR
jgi:hypothetical protein